MKRLIKADNLKYLHTTWYNPNEGENFTIDKVVDEEYELEYPEFCDYVSTYDFDLYIDDNYLERVAKRLKRR